MERCLSVQLVHCYISRLEGLTKPVARKATGIFFADAQISIPFAKGDSVLPIA